VVGPGRVTVGDDLTAGEQLIAVLEEEAGGPEVDEEDRREAGAHRAAAPPLLDYRQHPGMVGALDGAKPQLVA
jgi:hypothetical protein